MKCELSKKEFPCLWESGGSFTNTGDSIIIADKNGDPKKPIYIRTSGSLACENHALIPIEIGDIIINCSHHRYDFTIRVNKINSIVNDEIEVEQLNSFSQGEWDFELESCLEEAVCISKYKASDYHCRTPYFIKQEGN